MGSYRELAPPPRLAELVECFWISREDPHSSTLQRVLPDGCADLIYSRHTQAPALRLVGSMTRFADHEQVAGSWLVGIRFRPALWSSLLRLNATDLRDQLLPFSDVWAGAAARLSAQLENAGDPVCCVPLLADWLPALTAESPAQRALAALERSHGQLSLDGAASAACLSTRQFRRSCLAATGLSPKLLSRILRFRWARARAAAMPRRHAELAAECGYTDQSHMIAEFRRFGGRTPAAHP